MAETNRKEHRWLRVLRYFYLKLLNQKDQPDRIAGGVALGIFLGFILPPGVQIVVAVAVAPLLRCNPVAAAICVWVSNPITFPFIYPVALTIGAYLTGLRAREIIPVEHPHFWAFVTDFRAHGRTITLLWLGLLFIGAASSIPSYYVSRFLATRYQARRRHAVAAKKRKAAQSPRAQ